MKMTAEDALRSPCIGQCCLDDADICVGCKRHIEEITGWHSANSDARRIILKRCIERGNIALPSDLD
jgi:predicted Fe-S protein YdhL (DUF1289 family)